MNIMKITKAIALAVQAHSGQTRKDKSVPYIVHPIGVSMLLAKAGASDDVVIAGILHDTIEDTNVTYKQIKYHFGETVADLVAIVTNPKEVTSEMVKETILNRITTMSRDAILIKSADLLYNMTDTVNYYNINGKLPFSEKHTRYYINIVNALVKRAIDNPFIAELQKYAIEFKKILTSEQLDSIVYTTSMAKLMSKGKGLKIPTYMEIDGQVAKIEPIAKGGARVSVPKGMSIADFLQDGTKITKEAYDKLAVKSEH